MAQPVPRGGNVALRYVVPGLVLGGFVALGAPVLYVRSPSGTGQYDPIAQPVPFDHEHHATLAEIDCLYCHPDALRAAYAGVPATEVCMGCHRQVWRNAPVLAPVRESLAKGSSIAWRRVNSLPAFVFFNHSIHLAKGVGCTTCHGQVAGMSQVYQKEPLTMGFCLGCHRNPVPELRPRDQLTAAVWEPPGGEAERYAIAERYGVRRLKSCTTCHR